MSGQFIHINEDDLQQVFSYELWFAARILNCTGGDGCLELPQRMSRWFLYGKQIAIIFAFVTISTLKLCRKQIAMKQIMRKILPWYFDTLEGFESPPDAWSSH